MLSTPCSGMHKDFIKNQVVKQEASVIKYLTVKDENNDDDDDDDGVDDESGYNCILKDTCLL